MAVYPRWRGEHAIRQSDMPELDGLSPLARGTRGADYDFPIIYRFIPAGAGNTLAACPCCYAAPVYPRWRGEHCATPIPSEF